MFYSDMQINNLYRKSAKSHSTAVGLPSGYGVYMANRFCDVGAQTWRGVPPVAPILTAAALMGWPQLVDLY